MKIYIFALAAYGRGISGGDRIFIELARRWSRKSLVSIYVWSEGYEMCQRQKLLSKNIKFYVSKMNLWRKFGFIVNYVARIIEGVRIGFTLKIENSSAILIYSSSEFWMDLFPALILKFRFPKITLATAWYQTAPNPLEGFSGGRYKFKAFLYWLVQLPIKPLIANFANFVLVNNKEEKKQFYRLNRKEKAIVVLGAVPIESINAWKGKKVKMSIKYDAVFQGRFHPQKGVVELIDIWKKVVDKKPDACLAMIGDGPLRKEVELRIKKHELNKNVKLFGYVFDGSKKYRIFSQSKIVVHPAFYDSGGMAAAEAMAFGIPAIGFSLKSYESYYPEGMIKVKTGDLDAFAREITELLENEKKRKSLGREAKNMIEKSWSWEVRAEQLLSTLTA